MRQRVKITVRGDIPKVELRGYMDVDSYEALGQFAEVMKPYGIVVASVAPPDYNAFRDGDAESRRMYDLGFREALAGSEEPI